MLPTLIVIVLGALAALILAGAVFFCALASLVTVLMERADRRARVRADAAVEAELQQMIARAAR